LKYYDAEASQKYSYKAKYLSEKINYWPGKRRAYYSIFTHHYHQGSEPDSLLFYVKALDEVTKRSGDSMQLIYVVNSYALYYQRINDLQNNLKSNLEGLRLIRKFNKRAGMEGALLHNIGLLFSRLGDDVKCLKYLQEGYEIMDDETSKAMFLLSIGATHYALYNDIDTIQVFYDEALRVFEETNNIYGLIRAKQSKASYYEEKSDSLKALELLLEAKALIETGDFGLLKIGIYSHLASVCLTLERYNQAVDYGNQAIGFIKNTKNYEFFSRAYKPVYKSYQAIKDYKNALVVWEEYSELKDSLALNKYNTEVEELEANYLVKEKEKENELLKAEQLITKSRIRNRSIIAIILLIGFGFAIG
jgi:tetratricopeptide (TPR) repeat protein